MIRLFTMVISIICVFTAASGLAQDKQLKFTKKEARKNCVAYLKAIIEANPPSIALYNKYHSQHDESEISEELNHCYRTWGEPYSCKGSELVLETNCIKYSRERADSSPAKTPSLYLTKIQEILRAYKGPLKIINIKLIKYDNNFADYIVIGRINSTKVELRHAASEMSWELGGLVNITKINNKDITSLVPSEPYTVPDCNKR